MSMSITVDDKDSVNKYHNGDYTHNHITGVYVGGGETIRKDYVPEAYKYYSDAEYVPLLDVIHIFKLKTRLVIKLFAKNNNIELKNLVVSF